MSDGDEGIENICYYHGSTEAILIHILKFTKSKATNNIYAIAHRSGPLLENK